MSEDQQTPVPGVGGDPADESRAAAAGVPGVPAAAGVPGVPVAPVVPVVPVVQAPDALPAPAPIEPPRWGEYASPAPVASPPQYGAYPPPPPPTGTAPPQYGAYPPPPPPTGTAPPQYGAYPPPPPPPTAVAPPPYPAYPANPAYRAAPNAAVAGGAPGTGWAPPPKPGLVPLRPLGFGTLLGAPFQVLRRNPGPTFGSALIIQFAISLVTVLFIGGATFFAVTRVNQASAADQGSIAAGSVAIVLLSTLVPIALALVTSALLQGILVVEVSREVLGEKRRMGELWRAAGRRLWPLMLWILLEAAAIIVVLAFAVGIVVALASIGGAAGVALAIIAGLLFFAGLAVLAVWLGTKLSLVPCAIVLERIGVRAAIARSWRLTRGSFWKTFGVEALVAVIVYVAAQVVTQPVNIILSLAFGLLSPNDSGQTSNTAIVGIVVTYLIVGVLQIVFGAITAVVQAAAISVLYIDLRMRREGLDLELIRYVDARQAGLVTADDDPFRVYGTAA